MTRIVICCSEYVPGHARQRSSVLCNLDDRQQVPRLRLAPANCIFTRLQYASYARPSSVFVAQVKLIARQRLMLEERVPDVQGERQRVRYVPLC